MRPCMKCKTPTVCLLPLGLYLQIWPHPDYLTRYQEGVMGCNVNHFLGVSPLPDCPICTIQDNYGHDII